MGRLIVCRLCGEEKDHKADGCCATCYAADYRDRRGDGAPLVDGRGSPGLAAILGAPGGPTMRQVDNWVRRGLLRPTVVPGEGRDRWEWDPTEQFVAVRMARLFTAGLRADAAERVARHPAGGPVVLGPQIVISVFPLRPAANVEEARAS
jgi:hypothetical protein